MIPPFSLCFVIISDGRKHTKENTSVYINSVFLHLRQIFDIYIYMGAFTIRWTGGQNLFILQGFALYARFINKHQTFCSVDRICKL